MLRRHLLPSLALAGWLCAPILAWGQDVVQLVVTGNGPSRDQAVARALARAVRQALPEASQGIKDLDGFFLDYVRQEQAIPLDHLGNAHRLGSFYNPAGAFVRSYAVTASSRSALGWHATVAADVTREPSAAELEPGIVGLVIAPPLLQQEEEAEVAGGDAQVAALAARRDLFTLRDILARQLGQLPGLRVAAGSPAQDQLLANAVEAPASVHWAELPAQVDARQALTLEAVEFSLEQKIYPRGQSSLGKPLWDVFANVNYRLIDMPSSELLASGRVRLDLNNEWVYRQALEQKGDTPAAVKQRLLSEIARLLAADIMAEIRPPRVVGRRGDAILVDAGGMSLTVGQRLAVLGRGEMLKDELSGLPYRADGARIALLELVRRNGSQFEARLVQGLADAVLRGTLLRPTGLAYQLKR